VESFFLCNDFSVFCLKSREGIHFPKELTSRSLCLRFGQVVASFPKRGAVFTGVGRGMFDQKKGKRKDKTNGHSYGSHEPFSLSCLETLKPPNLPFLLFSSKPLGDWNHVLVSF